MSAPFAGIKVVDFSWVGVGPITARYLGDFGATVVRVESATRPETLRLTPPFAGEQPGLNRSGYFANYNCNKLGVTINLKHQQGPTLARRLAAWADVAIESFTPGTMADLGLSYQELAQANPGLIMLSTCNQGQTGPRASQPGFGTQLVSQAGFTWLTGWPDRTPTQPYAAYTDLIAPKLGAAAVAAALDYRRRSGRGQHLDLSQLEAGIQFLAPQVLDYTVNGRVAMRQGNRDENWAPHGAYRCQGQDSFIALAVTCGQEWQALVRTVGEPWCDDARFQDAPGRLQHQDELDRLLEGWTSHWRAAELMARLQQAGVPAGVVLSPEEIHSDPQLAHRGHFWHLQHPEIGRHAYDGPAFRLSRTPGDVRLPAPLLGQHNEQVFVGMLGLSDQEFVALLASGALE